MHTQSLQCFFYETSHSNTCWAQFRGKAKDPPPGEHLSALPSLHHVHSSGENFSGFPSAGTQCFRERKGSLLRTSKLARLFYLVKLFLLGQALRMLTHSCIRRSTEDHIHSSRPSVTRCGSDFKKKYTTKHNL